ncbi:MAG: AAA family ATPase [Chloroflexi bacterium]|nr:AAA family ATPase [Chloroflexota bacterium]
MRIESVFARAFGPFVGERLDLAPGMSVIWGPNEAGKSTWHAALYFGLCGRRRGAGQPSREEREMRARHEPWDGAQWEAGTRIRLEDERTIELRYDLRELTNCTAIDVGLGRSCADEITIGNDAPDGARWLGLDRRTFLAVACVRQGDLLLVRQNGRLIQDHLQRGAATGGADETAAVALERIDQFRKEQVGASHRAAVGPRRRATVAVDRAHEVLQTARADHEAFAELQSRLHGRDLAESAARAVLDRTQIARAKVEASPPSRVLQERAEEAQRRVAAASARKVSQRLVMAGLILAVLGIGVGVVLQPFAGGAMVLIGLGMTVLGVGRRDEETMAAALDDLRSAEMAVSADREARIRAAFEAETAAMRSYETATKAATELRTQIAERKRNLTIVAEAEEQLATAEAELARIDALDHTLELTRSFLLRAQERVHRSIAPRLAEQVTAWLPLVTAGRYTEAIVDPASLAVGVRAENGIWRDAGLLSHGTAEQIYLLLRIALADQLTRHGELCPLILDDPTPHFDTERTLAVLDLLLKVAKDRQVILFSQEPEILTWAQCHLEQSEAAGRHRLALLDGPAPII